MMNNDFLGGMFKFLSNFQPLWFHYTIKKPNKQWVLSLLTWQFISKITVHFAKPGNDKITLI